MRPVEGMSILITGGGGFLGFRLAKALLARGLTEADLLVPVEAVDAERMAEIMEGQDVILSF